MASSRTALIPRPLLPFLAPVGSHKQRSSNRPLGMQEFINDSSLGQLSLIGSVSSLLFLRIPTGTKIRLGDKNKNTPSPQNLTFLLSNKHTTTQEKGGTSPHLSREWG